VSEAKTVALKVPERHTSIVVTSISGPNHVMRELAAGSERNRQRFYVIGDVPSPPEFHLDGCEFLSIAQQKQTGFRIAEASPVRHYSRKNIGYLQAIRDGASSIVETDDDNLPQAAFWEERVRHQAVPLVLTGGWVNIYRYFTEVQIWPRGLPLPSVSAPVPDWASLSVTQVDCPIQQGLADENPDVDAIYRLILPLPVRFRKDRRLALGTGTWCPFNSQNTAFWEDAFPLLYLPACCSFRMTDIWRSLVAQRICWENDWRVLFHEPTVTQERNEHDLMRDFRDELPGYMKNGAIRDIMESQRLQPGVDHIHDNLRVCYQALVAAAIVEKAELSLLDLWLDDLTTALRR
jgi:hypothetical protein